MPKPKRKLTAAEKRSRRERKKNFMTIFVNGKQKRVRRPQLIDRSAGRRVHRAKRGPHLAAPERHVGAHDGR